MLTCIFMIVWKYYVFVFLSFDTASHDTGAILLAYLGGIPAGLSGLSFFQLCSTKDLNVFSKRTRGRQVLTV